MGERASIMPWSSNSTTSGVDGCRCINASDVLASYVERSCTTSGGQDGILLTVSGPCIDYAYGSTSCLPHDWMVLPACQVTGLAVSDIPGYCNRPWCWVDAMSCMGESSERVIASTYFPAGETGADLFYSYSTCGSSAEDWLESLENNAIGKKSLLAITAAYNIVPYVYKRNETGDIQVVPGSEYYDNSVPHEGVHINYVKALSKISEGDFTVDFVHGSRASRRVHPASPGTAAVQDVADGLVDIAVGPIWITGARLKMTTFTMPIQQDKTVLVIPRPGTERSLVEETKKVLDPFTTEVWFLLLGIIAVAALLSVWFSGKRSRRPGVYARLALDEFLQNGIFFCSAGIEQDERASLPRKLLMFGFAFLILIVVSSYVANLASFLTRSGAKHAYTIEDVIAREMPICAHPALAGDLQLAHPDAKFVFNQEGKEIYGILGDYIAGKCEVMAVGKMDSLGDLQLMKLFCEENLVYTDSLIIENPVGFPVRSDLASGFSYWMYQGEKYHSINVQLLQDEYNKEMKIQPSCNVLLSEQDDEASEFAQIDVQNLFFPIMVFVGFAVLAAILQLYYKCAMKRVRTRGGHGGRRASLMGSDLIGTHSSLNLRPHSRKMVRQATFDDDKKEDEEDVFDVQLPQVFDVQLPQPIQDSTNTIATGTITSDNGVHLDDFHENKKVRFSVNSSSQEIGFDQTIVEDGNLFLDHEDDAALSQFPQQLNMSQFQQKLDDFIDCYQKVKRQKKSG